MSSYPSGVYAPRTKENKPGVVYDAGKSTVGFAEDVTKLDDEVVAIETELGVCPKGSATDVAERLDDMDDWNGKIEIANIFSNTYEVELEETSSSTLQLPGYSGYSEAGLPIFHPKPCHIDKITVSISPVPASGVEVVFTLLKNGVAACDPITFTNAGGSPQELSVDVDFDGDDYISYKFAYLDDYEYEVYTGTIILQGYFNGPAIQIPFIDSRVAELEENKVIRYNIPAFIAKNVNTPQVVPSFSISLNALRVYRIKIFLLTSLYQTSGCKWNINLTNYTSEFLRRQSDVPTTPVCTESTLYEINPSSDGDYIDIVEGIFYIQSSNSVLTFRFSQATAQTHDTKILKGSYIEIVDIGSNT